MRYTLIQRRPFPIYDVEFEGKRGTLMKSKDGGIRCKRWALVEDENLEEVKYFPSRRAALFFFETGEKFKTNPVYATLGGRKGTTRIR